MRKVIGVDEVGRGAWAGPLVAGAISLTKPVEGLKDSKKLSRKQREDLGKIIQEQADFIGLGWVTPSEIDDNGLSNAMTLACERAVKKASKNSKIIIDGNVNYLLEVHPRAECLVNADETEPAVSAASIIAKVARDKYMEEIAKKYPNYNFAKNVGYGTKVHIKALEKHGLTPIHRWSFKPIKKLIDTYEV